MSRVYGGHKGYRWPRQKCPSCGRETACSVNVGDHTTVRLRRHNDPRTGLSCSIRDVPRQW